MENRFDLKITASATRSELAADLIKIASKISDPNISNDDLFFEEEDCDSIIEIKIWDPFEQRVLEASEGLRMRLM
ncbi:hypothetical protein SAMN05428988_3154 [Chitinophaga sp. YR573]|uniref:hypothetical protein n=1 Tax=Chitinophaga sp. YR573 TaxID=1881040 RepID=UPI0008AD5C87|nr:hypothetical protein [Chitinophaga sp. YR573]SEW20959.1 hypothetical protein SAMN05428988_3154 [Chitinophaga sp. YR573]